MFFYLFFYRVQINGDGRLRHRRTANVSLDMVASEDDEIDHNWQESGSKQLQTVSLEFFRSVTVFKVEFQLIN